MKKEKKKKQYAVFATFKTTGMYSSMTLPMCKKDAEKILVSLKQKSTEFRKLNFKGFKIQSV